MQRSHNATMKATVMVAAVFLVPSSYIFTWLNNTQPGPYMDEIFHIPQAQNYCHGNWHHWDSKITTLPGLYLVSNVVFRALAGFTTMSVTELCSVSGLRAINVFLAVINCLLLIDIFSLLHGKGQNSHSSHFIGKLQLCGLVVSTFPLLYFFSFLYYTDLASTVFILLCYCLAHRDRHKQAALAGAAAIVSRQTNIVWVGFVAAVSVLRLLKKYNASFAAVGDDISSLWRVFPCTLRNTNLLLQFVWPYLPVGAAFVVFLIHNGGIVVGDKSNHHPVLHYVQFFYFLLFSACFTWSHLITLQRILHVLVNIGRILRQGPLVFVIFSVMFIIIRKGTFVHPFLLADNRHYPFYIWRYAFASNPFHKYYLIPLYLVAFLFLNQSLRDSYTPARSPVWQLLFWLCVMVVTVPQQLVEFRYFIIPFLLLRLHFPATSVPSLVGELLTYTAVNAVTFYLFMNKPFYWPSEPGVLQRFMW